ncbi:unnamed protein product [Haemonchus placei]|uniref:Uncharacterized protein n=1 Tax=Haemonchus placei TaxID=6290 RepID=A0A0N4W2G7_HAEPC|nr:unnamed protein product [Haemonchus placei]
MKYASVKGQNYYLTGNQITNNDHSVIEICFPRIVVYWCPFRLFHVEFVDDLISYPDPSLCATIDRIICINFHYGSIFRLHNGDTWNEWRFIIHSREVVSCTGFRQFYFLACHLFQIRSGEPSVRDGVFIYSFFIGKEICYIYAKSIIVQTRIVNLFQDSMFRYAIGFFHSSK